MQEKCAEQNKDLFAVFVDLTKAFDTIDREDLWKILHKLRCPEHFVSVIRSFHDGMTARVQEGGTFSEPFTVSNGTKQGCVLAPTLFTIVFSVMLLDAFKDTERGIYIQFHTDGNLFNLRRLQAKTKVLEMLIRELLYADDCALIAHTQEDIQHMTDCFAKATKRFGLTISLKKTEVLYQPAPGKAYKDPLVSIDGTTLNSVKSFCYLGSDISNTGSIDKELTQRIAKASSSFGRLRHRLWSKHDIKLHTKIQVYRAVVLTTLLYGCETWTVYRRHIKQLDQFHLRCLRSICDIKWQDMVPNTVVLERCELPGMESLLIKAQLRWAGHVTRMPDTRIPKAVLFGQLKHGKRGVGRPRLRYRDTLKRSLVACHLGNDWQQQAQDRATWRSLVHSGVDRFEEERISEIKMKRERRKNTNMDAEGTFKCPSCGRGCRSRIGLISHTKTHK